MVAALVLLAAAALGGIAMLVLRARSGENPPTALAAGHGILAIAGFITLVTVTTRQGILPIPTAAVPVFVFAILMGFVMFTKFHTRGEPLPLGLAAAHATAAIAGITLLVIAMLAGGENRGREPIEGADIPAVGANRP